MKTATARSLRLILRLGAIVILLIGSLGSVPAVETQAAPRAATLTVTNTNDEGAGSLRQAIADAAAGDTIVFNGGLSGGTITLASTLNLNKNLTIDGSALAVPITLNGNNAVKIISLSAVIVLKQLKLLNGSNPGGDGGAIYNGGDLTVTNCTISNNTAGRGAGIFNAGWLVVSGSTFASNSVGDGGSGGAIFAGGTGIGHQIHVANSTFYQNHGGVGGAVYNQLAPGNYVGVEFYNNTFFWNTAAIAGGALYNGMGGRLWIANNIMAQSNNLAGDCYSDPSNTTANIVEYHNNYIQNNVHFRCGPSLWGSALLAGLGDYGGPTQTMPLMPGSVGYNQGWGALCPATDQRGVARPQGTACEVGAFEAELPVVTTNAASGITSTGATLNATINARFSETTPSFEYGRTTAYGAAVSGAPLNINGGTGTAVTAAIGGLEFNRTYHFRAKGVSAAGTTLGGDQSFTTSCGPAVTVQNTHDSGDGSLRQALLDTCAGGTITFNPSLSGQVIRFLTHIILNKSISIDGTGLSTPITLSGDSTGDGTGDVRIFWVNNGVSASLKKLTLTKGKVTDTSGGAIYNAGTLSLQNSTVSDSIAEKISTNGFGGGIFNTSGGTLTITDSTFSGNATSGVNTYGGAIYSNGSLTVTSSTFSLNTAVFGGGAISNNGTLELTNATFSGNNAPYGGGLENQLNKTATVKNVTFSGNTAATGGGGIFNAGTLHLSNTIAANSSAPEDCRNSSGSISTNNNNLIEVNSGCSTPALTSDPNLGALGNNGGPTQTFALIAGSPAIDAGHAGSCAALDQRGVVRPQGSLCDIGALERDTTLPSVTIEQAAGQADPASSFPINFTVTFTEPIDPATFTPSDIVQGGTATDIVWQITDGGAHSTYTLAAISSSVGTLIPSLPASSVQDFSLFGNTASTSVDHSVFFCANTTKVSSLADSGPGTLRAALLGACVDGTITFHTSLAGGTILLASPLVVTQNVTVNGLIGDQRLTVTLDGQNTVRVMQVSAGVTANLDVLNFAHGKAASGAGIINSGTLKVTRSAFFGNTSTTTGGGIENTSTGNLTLANNTFYSNSAAQKGGGIYNSGTLTSKHNTFTLNTAAQGGGIHNAAGAMLDFANTLAANSTGGDCVNAGTLGLNLKNLTEDHSCAVEFFGDPLLAEPGWYYGPTNTAALLPGSIAINSADTATCNSSPVNGADQRGIQRPELGSGNPAEVRWCDIGAYESRGTLLTFDVPPSGDNQSVPLNTAFPQPLKVSISNRDGTLIEPMIGGKITFTAPVSGASATFDPVVATIMGPVAGNWYYALGYATANGQIGTYQLNANTVGARWLNDPEITTGVNFTATNCYASVVVTNAADAGAGSLRQALADACPGAVITFDASLSGQTIALASTLTLSKEVVIDGSALAQQVKLSGENAVRVVVINSGVAVTLKSLTITKGKAINTDCTPICGGGGISNAGSLALLNSQVTENTATGTNGGGIASTGILTITGSTFTNNTKATSSGGGGAIYTTGSMMSIERSTFNTNSSSLYGGAIYAQAPYTINASAFVSNSAMMGGGAIHAVYSSTTPSTITGSTFSGNTSSGTGGAIASLAALNVTNSTFSGNSAAVYGGGIYIARALTLLNSTFSGNSATTSGGAVNLASLAVLNYTNTILANSPSGQDCVVTGTGPTVGTNLNNLVGSSTGCGTPTLTADPLLGVLANNGGPTQTMALLPGSPALNAGNAAACPATDQRGMPRLNPAACDIGAYEVVQQIFLPVISR